jgi:hypothetical protein
MTPTLEFVNMLSSSLVFLRILYLEAFYLSYWIESFFFYACTDIDAVIPAFEGLIALKSGLVSETIDLVNVLGG